MQLKVKGLAPQDCWKDIVRIKEPYRVDQHGKKIRRGRICCISVGDRSVWVVVHGRQTDEPIIQMDLNVRRALGVKKEQVQDFELRQISWVRSLWFPWVASDPGYRLPAQLALLSAIVGTILGIAGVVLGIMALKHP
jgi:hypothetical protein